MATCSGRIVAVRGRKGAGRAMGRCAGDHETTQGGRKARGGNSRAMEGVEFRLKNPGRPSSVWSAVRSTGNELCAGKRDGRGFSVWRDGAAAGFYRDVDWHAVSRCWGLSRG